MKTFFRVAGAECRKAFCSKAFLLGTALLLLFSVLSAVYMIEVRASYNPGQVWQTRWTASSPTTRTCPCSPFTTPGWAGTTLSLASALFYALLPVGAALPFSWSYCTERKSGYLKNIYTRVDKKTDLAGKTLAVFLSGAGAVAVKPGGQPAAGAGEGAPGHPFCGLQLLQPHLFSATSGPTCTSPPRGLYVLLYAVLDVFYGGGSLPCSASRWDFTSPACWRWCSSPSC